MTPELVEQILEKEKPDAILPTMGGQTALNLAKALAEVRRLVQRKQKAESKTARTCAETEGPSAIPKDCAHLGRDAAMFTAASAN
jgi:hypothetical protein